MSAIVVAAVPEGRVALSPSRPPLALRPLALALALDAQICVCVLSRDGALAGAEW